MMRFLKWLFLLPISAGIVLLAIANRHFVPVLLDPFGHDTPDLEISAPLFVVIFGAAIVGVIFGGIATWLGQSKHRIAARRAKSELSQIRNEADTLRKQLAHVQNLTQITHQNQSRPAA
jgi:uncharacterized integral membrane protein